MDNRIFSCTYIYDLYACEYTWELQHIIIASSKGFCSVCTEFDPWEISGLAQSLAHSSHPSTWWPDLIVLNFGLSGASALTLYYQLSSDWVLFFCFFDVCVCVCVCVCVQTVKKNTRRVHPVLWSQTPCLFHHKPMLNLHKSATGNAFSYLLHSRCCHFYCLCLNHGLNLSFIWGQLIKWQLHYFLLQITEMCNFCHLTSRLAMGMLLAVVRLRGTGQKWPFSSFLPCKGGSQCWYIIFKLQTVNCENLSVKHCHQST